MSGKTQQAFQGYSFTHIGANGTFSIFTIVTGNPGGAIGLFAGASINSPGSVWSITVYDGTVGQNIVVAVISPSTYAPPSNFPIQLVNGLTAVASGTTAGSVTIAWL